MIFKRISLLIIATTIALSSCITNDIPYPVVELGITSITVEGTSADCSIDHVNRTINIPLKENTDIRNVKITDVEYTEGATLSKPIVGTFDMRYPQYVTLSLYQDYEWTISAKQTIDRRFAVYGQIGDTEWDVDRCIAKVYRRADFGIDTVTVSQLRFGPAPEYVCNRDKSELRDFTSGKEPNTLTATVDAYGRQEIWRLIVEPREPSVEITRCMVGSQVIWLSASGIDGAESGFRYRASNEEQWNDVPEQWYTSKGGKMELVIRHLMPNTGYELYGYAITDNGEQRSEVRNVTTGSIFTLPNAGFEDWHLDGKIWNPSSSAETKWWDTGNKGSSIAGVILTSPLNTSLHEGTTGTTCVQMSSQNAVLKFAAGNCFVGEFDKIVGTDGLVNFGRPYTERPTALKGWVKYQQGIIDCAPKPDMQGKTPNIGEKDGGIIYIAVGKWDAATYGGTETSPVQVDTRNEASFFNSQNKGIIGYGEIKFDASCEWYEFNIPLEYRDYETAPTHIILVCTSSRYGDYYVGSSTSTMWIDDLELCYDLD
ncbi:MAG: PCMD domain-containing protein [Alistipes sp.]|nr:PCMD domain-containing protein [Alistipes sp.]